MAKRIMLRVPWVDFGHGWLMRSNEYQYNTWSAFEAIGKFNMCVLKVYWVYWVAFLMDHPGSSQCIELQTVYWPWQIFIERVIPTDFDVFLEFHFSLWGEISCQVVYFFNHFDRFLMRYISLFEASIWFWWSFQNLQHLQYPWKCLSVHAPPASDIC